MFNFGFRHLESSIVIEKHVIINYTISSSRTCSTWNRFSISESIPIVWHYAGNFWLHNMLGNGILAWTLQMKWTKILPHTSTDCSTYTWLSWRYNILCHYMFKFQCSTTLIHSKFHFVYLIHQLARHEYCAGEHDYFACISQINMTKHIMWR